VAAGDQAPAPPPTLKGIRLGSIGSCNSPQCFVYTRDDEGGCNGRRRESNLIYPTRNPIGELVKQLEGLPRPSEIEVHDDEVLPEPSRL
jgi:hypothetical protein